MGYISEGAFVSSPPTSRMMPPVMAMRDLRSLSFPPQVVHFIPIQATPRPATDTMMPTIIKARVAWSEPGADRGEGKKNDYVWDQYQKSVLVPLEGRQWIDGLLFWGMWECGLKRLKKYSTLQKQKADMKSNDLSYMQSANLEAQTGKW